MNKRDTISRREILATTLAAGGYALTKPIKSALALDTKRTPARKLMIDAKPEPVVIDAVKAAVIVIDMQNDFGAEGGMFQRAGIDISMIKAAVMPTAKVLASARIAGIKIIYLKMAYMPDLSDAGPSDSPLVARSLKRFRIGKRVESPTGTEGGILVRDTWNTDILRELTPKADDLVLYKHRYSGFYETELDQILRRLGIKYLIFTGCTTSVCVESTVRDARFRDYLPVVLSDCTAEPIGHDLPRTNHEATLFLIEKLFGWVSTSNHFIKGLKSVTDKS